MMTKDTINNALEALMFIEVESEDCKSIFSSEIETIRSCLEQSMTSDRHDALKEKIKEFIADYRNPDSFKRIDDVCDFSVSLAKQGLVHDMHDLTSALADVLVEDKIDPRFVFSIFLFGLGFGFFPNREKTYGRA